MGLGLAARAPSHDLFSDMVRACAVTSIGESCGSSLGCVCILVRVKVRARARARARARVKDLGSG